MSFWKNHGKLQTTRSTSANEEWIWHLPSTSLWAQPLVGPRTDSSTSMPYPGPLDQQPASDPLYRRSALQTNGINISNSCNKIRNSRQGTTRLYVIRFSLKIVRHYYRLKKIYYILFSKKMQFNSWDKFTAKYKYIETFQYLFKTIRNRLSKHSQKIGKLNFLRNYFLSRYKKIIIIM